MYIEPITIFAVAFALGALLASVVALFIAK